MEIIKITQVNINSKPMNLLPLDTIEYEIEDQILIAVTLRIQECVENSVNKIIQNKMIPSLQNNQRIINDEVWTIL